MNFQKIINAWQQASEDMQIKIQAPFILTVDNQTISFELLIENFGSENGTVIYSTDNINDMDTPKMFGFYCSSLNPESYSIYNSQLFIDTLNDWGYFGDKSKTPIWYTGKPWSEVH
jgi:hypothetical protein